MSLKQPTLLNLKALASTKSVRAVQRARTRADFLSRRPVETMRESKPLVPSADSTLSQRNDSTQKLRIQSAELLYPDEDRILAVLWDHKRCKVCFVQPVLERINKLYRVRCGKLPSSAYKGCPEPTPFFPSSTEAVNYHKLIQKMQAL